MIVSGGMVRGPFSCLPPVRDVITGASAMNDAAQPGVDLATGSGLVDAFAACLRVKQLLRPS